MIETRTLQGQLAKHRAQRHLAAILVVSGGPTLGTPALPSKKVLDLLFNYQLLQLSQNRFALGQCQAHRVRLHSFSLNTGNLVFLFLPIVCRQNHVEGEFHVNAPSLMREFAELCIYASTSEMM